MQFKLKLLPGGTKNQSVTSQNCERSTGASSALNNFTFDRERTMGSEREECNSDHKDTPTRLEPFNQAVR